MSQRNRHVLLWTGARPTRSPHTIRVLSDSLLSILSDILDFSKIESGELEFEQQPMGGRIWVERVEGEGSVFHVELPLTPIKAHVMVIGSDGTSWRLKSWGVTVSTAASGQEALALWERQPAELVLAAFEMPGMDGLDVAAALKGRRW